MELSRGSINSRRLIIALAVLVLGIVILRTAWVCDDAYISFRTVDNFVHGHGPVSYTHLRAHET